MSEETKKEIAEEVTRQVLEAIKRDVIPAVQSSIQTHVNGKIDRLHTKLDEHMDEIQPFLDGWKGGKIIGNVIKWTAGLVIAIGGALAVISNIK